MYIINVKIIRIVAIALILIPGFGNLMYEAINAPIITTAGKTIRTGDHDCYLNGLFIGYGPDIKNNKLIKEAQLIDITPTILHMMGFPIPNDMDGVVLKEIFKEESNLAKTNIKYKKYNKERTLLKEKIKTLKLKGEI